MKNKLISVFVTFGLLFSATNISYAEEINEENIFEENITTEDVIDSSASDKDNTITSEEDSIEADDFNENEDATDVNNTDIDNIDTDNIDDIDTDDINITDIDKDIVLENCTLSDSDTGISITGSFPNDSYIHVSILDPEETIQASVLEHNSTMSYNEDSFEFYFIENTYSIDVYDSNGNLYTTSDTITITKKFDNDTYSRLDNHKMLAFINDSSVDCQYSSNGKELSFTSKGLDSVYTFEGIETYEFCTITFEILSKKDDSFITSSECRYKIGDEIIIPEFYSKDYKRINNLDWSKVDHIALGDATYTHFIDSNDYKVAKEN